MSPRLLLKILLLTTAALLLFACGGGDGGSVGPPRVPARLEVLSPTTVVTTDGVALPADSAPSVRVLTADSLPVKRVVVSFTLDSGPATLGGGTALPGGARGITTGADGVASLPTWIPATLAGEAETTQSVVTARLQDQAGVLLDSVRFTATAIGNRWRFVPASQDIDPWLRVATLGEGIYTYDGINLTVHDSIGDHWSFLARPATRHDIGGLVAINGRLMLAGGQHSAAVPGCIGYWNYCSTVEFYDPATDAWSPGPNMPEARMGQALVVLEGKVYALGGIDTASVSHPDVFRYDPATGQWTRRASMLATRFWVNAAVLDGVLYAGGGLEGEATIERYDPVADQWTVAATLPTPLYRPGFVALRNQLYVAGNTFVGSTPTTTIVLQRWDPADDTWTPLRTPPILRENWNATGFQERLYLIGGYTGREGPGLLMYTP